MLISSFYVQKKSRETLQVYVEKLQSKVEQGLRLLLKATSSYISRCLSYQKKDIYNVVVFEHDCTPTFIMICSFLEKQVEIVENGLDGRNKTNFVMNMAMNLQNIILQNISNRLTVNELGALLLLRDVDMVIQSIKKFQIYNNL
jgi:hypothetical protein